MPYTEPVGQNKYQKLNCSSAIAACIGSAGFAYYGIKSNPYTDKNGTIKDTFAKSVESAYIKNASENEKNLYKELKIVNKKIKNVKTPEELKKLIENNPEVKAKITTNYDTDKNNLKECIKNIKEEITTQQNTQRFNNITSKLKWDNKKKEFIKPENAENDKLYSALKKAKFWTKTKLVTKFAAMGFVFTGIVAYITGLLLSNKKNV